MPRKAKTRQDPSIVAIRTAYQTISYGNSEPDQVFLRPDLFLAYVRYFKTQQAEVIWPRFCNATVDRTFPGEQADIIMFNSRQTAAKFSGKFVLDDTQYGGIRRLGDPLPIEDDIFLTPPIVAYIA